MNRSLVSTDRRGQRILSVRFYGFVILSVIVLCEAVNGFIWMPVAARQSVPGREWEPFLFSLMTVGPFMGVVGAVAGLAIAALADLIYRLARVFISKRC